MTEATTHSVDHELKTDPDVFQAAMEHRKPWEIRNDEDRGFKKDDLVLLRETVYTGREMKEENQPLRYTERKILGRISYVLHGPAYGLEEGWVIFTLEPIETWGYV